MGDLSESVFFIDTKPSLKVGKSLKREPNGFIKGDFYRNKKHCSYDRKSSKRVSMNRNDDSFEIANKKTDVGDGNDGVLDASVAYYENVLKDLKNAFNSEIKDEVICNTLEESEGKEVGLACHGLVSHCLEILLADCKDTSIIIRFMAAFAENKVTVCTSANASHLTELLMNHAVKSLQIYNTVMNKEDIQDQTFAIYCVNWLVEFGNFALENLSDCLSCQYSCHVVCTLIGALAGDLARNKELMSKNLKIHKKEFHSQYTEACSPVLNKNSSTVVLEQIPGVFSDLLKALYKAVVRLENLIDSFNDSSSTTVIEALIFALSKRRPKACKKMITKLAKRMVFEKNKEGIPKCLLHRNTSFVFDDMFKAADEELQSKLWNEFISDHIGNLVMDPIGNFVIQRIYDAIINRTLFEMACKNTWCAFPKIAKSGNYGIFVSISTVCNRLGSQQAFFMENIMKCLDCYEPVERQDSLVPLLLGFKKFDFIFKKSLTICLQGSLVVQAILKFHKPMKVVKSILAMPPEDVEILAGHNQGCHVLNAFFNSVTVGDKNKEKLILHMQPVLVSMACDRNKSLTLSRIWTTLSLKHKEIIARHLVQHQHALKNTTSGYAVFKKFGIPRFRKFEEWKHMQTSICNKTLQKH